MQTPTALIGLALGLAWLPAVACKTPVATAPAATVAAGVVVDRLMFGRNVPGGGTVSDSAWSVFLAEVITPRFPSGFTTWRTDGQWRGDNGAIEREAGFAFEVSHPKGQPADSTFEAISLEYCRRFRQEAVLRVRSAAEVWLYRSKPR